MPTYHSVFPLSRFFSANRRFVGARANNFWQYSKHSFRKFDKFVEIWHLVCFITGVVQNLGHINVFLELWAQLFKENLGTHWLAIKLEGTQLPLQISGCVPECKFVWQWRDLVLTLLVLENRLIHCIKVCRIKLSKFIFSVSVPRIF